MTSWTAEFFWRDSSQKARERIREWTGVLEWNALDFRIDDAGSATATLTVEADTLADAYDLTRQIVDDFLGEEPLLQHLAATNDFLRPDAVWRPGTSTGSLGSAQRP